VPILRPLAFGHTRSQTTPRATTWARLWDMKTADLAEVLTLAQVDPTLYNFDGERHEALCLLAEGQTWKVFLSERGLRHDERSFPGEDEACTYFLKRILQLSRTR